MAKQLSRKPITPPASRRRAISKQYDLFTTFFGKNKDLSNTIELWDAIPKYSVLSRQQNVLRDEKGNLPVFEQDFEYRPSGKNMPDSIPCKLSIQPASIKNHKGVYTQFYPSTDEELVEEVLKKIFTDQKFGHHDPTSSESWVRFSLNMVQKELKKRGKTRSLDQIKQSLEILSRAVCEVQFAGKTKKLVYTNPVLTDLTRTTRSDYLEDPKSMWCAKLPALISKSVNELTYRQFNYGTLMNLSSPLARWLHKRLSHQYIQASLLHPYSINFTSMKRDSGLLHHSRTSSNLDTVHAAMEELVKNNVLLTYVQEVRKRGQKIEEVKYTLTPTAEFQQEIKAANAKQRDHREELGTRKVSSSGAR